MKNMAEGGKTDRRPVKRWRRRGNCIFFELVSTGFTGSQWVKFLMGIDMEVSENARNMLATDDFKPTIAGTIHRVVVYSGKGFACAAPTTAMICRVAKSDRLRKTPHPEVAPLIRRAFSDADIREMGLEEIATMHSPILGRLLDIDTGELESAPGDPTDTWHREHGFAFERR